MAEMQVLDLDEIQRQIDARKVPVCETNSSTGISKPGDPGHQYTPEERNTVNKFYSWIRIGWGSAKFTSQFEDEKDAVAARRFWAPRILEHSPEDLKRAIDVATQRRLEGDTRYDWPDIGVILGVLSEKPKKTSAAEAHQHRCASGRPPAVEFNPTVEFRMENIRKLREEHGL